MDAESYLNRLSDSHLKAQARAWLATDRNPQTLAQAQQLLREAPEEELKEIFCKHLVFGTAGLRGLMGPGYSRLNDVTIQQASQGLAMYLLDRHGKEACAARGIVIGRDCRHNSERFANLAAATFLSVGFKVLLCGAPVATPLVAFAALQQQTVAAAAVTASHNPKAYNGFKVFDCNGAQIVPPVDSRIAQAIQQHQELWPSVEKFFCRTSGKCSAAAANLSDPTAALTEAYVAAIAADLREPEGFRAAAPAAAAPAAAAAAAKEEKNNYNFKIVYTPLHGVGLPFVQKLFERCGMADVLLPGNNQQQQQLLLLLLQQQVRQQQQQQLFV
ncbi:phosphoglucomutase, putative [Eimeria tenella]|uniref:Phosphoglucomutase, putative n=1 Tax=Eimeria tenella TaxID=5802 RepID=U6KHM1_EIMTE|nr:phosphoglucomutase, putative [Eimeria tenella]CDJ37525.1 phosphoglucomutase, putative [Eimeria tenella]|eukprot:XP_013228363.1 phosphoglucomutase, putative [Eimeria tenella]